MKRSIDFIFDVGPIILLPVFVFLAIFLLFKQLVFGFKQMLN